MSSDVVVAVDAMGGDNAPGEIVKGCVKAASENIKVILVGRKDLIDEQLDKYNNGRDNIEVVDAKEVISNDESPTFAIRNKKDSSLIKGLDLVKEKKAMGFVSAGSTGALLSCATVMLRRLSGISRPALATPLPNSKGISLLLDSGANVDCKQIYLEQFAKMGSVYAEKVMKIENPKVGLINIGVESEKGNALTKEVFELLSNCSDLNFIGNVEARDISDGVADVLVCDGFAGNLILKNTEGMAKSIFKMLKSELNKNLFAKLGVALASSVFKTIKRKFDYEKIGGAPFLGLNSIVIKAHGSSHSEAIKNAIFQCVNFIESDFIQKIQVEKNM